MARDLDLLRMVLGNERLNDLGYSYGSWLGAWYAGLFPEKVGRMVLGGVLDFGASLEQMLYVQQPARQRLFDEVLAPYAVRHADYFRLGRSVEEVRAAVQALGPDVQSVLGDNLSDLAYRRRDANGYLERITVAQVLEAIRQQVPGLDDPDAVKAAINRHVFDPVIAERNAFLRKVAWEQFYASYIEIWLRPQKSIELHSALATGTAIRCNDTPSINDLAQWTAAVRSVAQQAPLHFGGLLDNHACAFWQRPQVQKPDVQALGGLDVLLVQAQYDAATPAEGANAFFLPACPPRAGAGRLPTRRLPLPRPLCRSAGNALFAGRAAHPARHGLPGACAGDGRTLTCGLGAAPIRPIRPKWASQPRPVGVPQPATGRDADRRLQARAATAHATGFPSEPPQRLRRPTGRGTRSHGPGRRLFAAAGTRGF